MARKHKQKARLATGLATFEAEISTHCMCGRQLLIGRPSLDGTIVGLHALPYCDDFVNLEPTEYITRVLEHMQELMLVEGSDATN
jgi:hypothetical protein